MTRLKNPRATKKQKPNKASVKVAKSPNEANSNANNIISVVEKPIKKRKRRQRKNGRRSHYITGTYNSKKCAAPINYRSSWELTVAEYMDNNEFIEMFQYESFAIPYVANEKTGRVRLYFPDFLVQYKDGSKIIVEVKPESKLNNKIVVKKAKAGKAWAEKNGMQYQIWTETLIKQMKASNLRTQKIKKD